MNIAVCLRGEIRTWNYIKDSVFKFYQSISERVDYYYSTWHVDYLDKDALDKSFEGRNLVQSHCVASGSDRNRWGALLGPALLSSNIKLNNQYDLIIDTRFDLLPLRCNQKISKPNANEIQTGFVDQILGKTDDRWAVMTQATWNKFSNRLPLLYKCWIDNLYRPVENEISLTATLKEMNLEAKNCIWMNSFIARPNIINIFPRSTDIDFGSWPLLNENYLEWNDLSDQSKKDFCLQQNIPLKEYRL